MLIRYLMENLFVTEKRLHKLKRGEDRFRLTDHRVASKEEVPQKSRHQRNGHDRHHIPYQFSSGLHTILAAVGEDIIFHVFLCPINSEMSFTQEVSVEIE